MFLTYDPKFNVAYLRLKESSGEVETIKVSDAVNIDLAPDGTLYGIEFLNANEQISGFPGGEFVVVNEASGAKAKLELP
ncbi:MAG: DUF2283 domain-containing protein [Calditrichaeota bacterium]|nr:DUF2283 domain-containing protein [Calditrichota bacterium]